MNKRQKITPTPDGYSGVQTAKLLNITYMTLYNWIRAGKISGRKVGKTWRIAPSEIARIRKAKKK